MKNATVSNAKTLTVILGLLLASPFVRAAEQSGVMPDFKACMSKAIQCRPTQAPSSGTQALTIYMELSSCIRQLAVAEGDTACFNEMGPMDAFAAEYAAALAAEKKN
jgi:hypothetical protein